MAAIVLRSIKGSPLTTQEVDDNFTNLSIELGTKLNTSAYTASDILTKLKSVDTDDSGLNATTLKSLNVDSTNTPSTVVSRDTSGNFAAGTITANLIGNVQGVVTGSLIGNSTNITGVVSMLNGGTGGSSPAQALTNLLPAGGTNGYVLKTAGPGSYYWAAETGALQQSGTRVNSTRNFFTATAGQTVFSNIATYVPGAGQLRVYVDGVRQFNSAYTETGSTSFTLSEGVVVGTQVMAEVDGYINYNYTAADVSFSPTSTLSSTNVQNAIVELLTEISPFIVPSGGIIIWSGAQANIPSGWVLCNGSNNTPDLRSRFIMGAGGVYNVGSTGGSADAIAVAHTHTGTTSTSGSHTHVQVVSGYDTDTGNGGSKGTHPVGSIYAYNTSGVGTQQNSSKSTIEAGMHNHTFTTDSTGSSGINANLPPYYALCYIMKL
jgi:hypothetical protein